MEFTCYAVSGNIEELYKRSKVKKMLGYVPDEYFVLKNGMVTTFSKFETTQALTDKLFLELAEKSKKRAAIFVGEKYKVESEEEFAEFGKLVALVKKHGIDKVNIRETFHAKEPKNFEGHASGYFRLLLTTAYESFREGICRN